jgi:hypothetical protein
MVQPTYAEHSNQMKEEYGSDFSESQHDLVYAKAYVDGHSGGYEEVERCYVDLVNFIAELKE